MRKFHASVFCAFISIFVQAPSTPPSSTVIPLVRFCFRYVLICFLQTSNFKRNFCGVLLLSVICSLPLPEMRPLDEAETTQVFEKLFKFTGNNLKNIVESPSHEGPDQNPSRFCFRLHKNRVYYVSESLVKRATNIKRENLVALGTNIGKFTKSGKFHLTIQALNLLAANAKHKVWLKPTSEMSFLYGNDVVKGGLGRITDNINAYDGVVVFSMSDLPLGFGIAAKSTQDCRKMDPNGLVVIRQADTGEYLRSQDDL